MARFRLSISESANILVCSNSLVHQCFRNYAVFHKRCKSMCGAPFFGLSPVLFERNMTLETAIVTTQSKYFFCRLFGDLMYYIVCTRREHDVTRKFMNVANMSALEILGVFHADPSFHVPAERCRMCTLHDDQPRQWLTRWYVRFIKSTPFFLRKNLIWD